MVGVRERLCAFSVQAEPTTQGESEGGVTKLLASGDW